MSEKQFVKGLNIKTKTTQYGDIIKVGINVNDFCDQNPMNERGYVNFDIKKGKSGKWYAELNTYGQKTEEEPINEDEIPF